MKIFVKITLSVVLTIYLLILTKLVVLKHIPISEIDRYLTFKHASFSSNNFIPFKTIIHYLFLSDVNLNIRVQNLAGNMLGFIPFGFLLPLLSRKFVSLKSVLVATFCLSLIYEVLQFISNLGSFDVDDLILNTLGGAVGYVPIKLVLTMKSSKKRKMDTLPLR